MDKYNDLQKVSRAALHNNMFRYFDKKGLNIDARAQRLGEWVSERMEADLWPYQLTVHPIASTRLTATTMAGISKTGINFTSVDYLGLSTHCFLQDVAHQAIDDYGLHSASAGSLMGNNKLSRQLEETIANYLDRQFVLLYPSGWSASFASITGIVRKHDIVVMDELAHQSLKQGAYAATGNVVSFRHLDNTDLQAHLKRIRKDDAHVGILVVTEGLFSMDSDSPNLNETVQICKSYDAKILIDVAHDLGVLGPKGTIGTLENPEDVDLIVGSFSKVFAAIGGFVATNSWGGHLMNCTFGGAYTYSTQLSPVTAAVANQAIQIVTSAEGAAYREKLFANITVFREEAQAKGLRCAGSPSPILPVIIGDETVARLANRISLDNGLICTVLEFPVVALGQARYRFSMTPLHTKQTITTALDIAKDSILQAQELAHHLESMHTPKENKR